MTYWRLHYHLIWATHERQPIITSEREKMFYGVLYKKADELNLKIHAGGNIEDHVHVVLSIPPVFAVSECVRQLKGASAYAINRMPGSDGQFKWQGGYGALSVGERSLEMVMEYAAKQKEHHRNNNLLQYMRELMKNDMVWSCAIRLSGAKAPCSTHGSHFGLITRVRLSGLS